MLSTYILLVFAIVSVVSALSSTTITLHTSEDTPIPSGDDNDARPSSLSTIDSAISAVAMVIREYYYGLMVLIYPHSISLSVAHE